MMKQLAYKNLTELLLNIIRHRPGMYLGRNHISKLPNFLLGYDFRDELSNGERDFYFGDKGFLVWYSNKYKPKEMSFWHDYFLAETENDEVKALELYFTRLEEYYTWHNTIATSI
jgi:hypothetical protein